MLKSEWLQTIIYNLKKSPLTILGLIIIIILNLCAIFAPYISSYQPDEINPIERLLPPSRDHLFGTDDAGRDIFSRIIYGARISIAVGFTVIILSSLIGVIVGIVAGYFGGIIDEIVMRITDIFFSIPYLILAIAIAAALGPNLINAMVAISIVWWPVYARLMRGQTLLIREMTYVEAARGLGASNFRILLRHIFPNSIPTIVIQASLDFGNAIYFASALSFIGLGAQPPSPEWGAMISVGKDHLIESWWYPTFPGLAILFAVLGSNLLGDGLRDLLDPRIKETS